MDEQTAHGLPGIILKVERNYANISIHGHGMARLDMSTARRLLDYRITDLQSLLEVGCSVFVRIKPFTEQTLSRLPSLAQDVVSQQGQQEVVFFRKDVQARRPDVSISALFKDIGSSSRIPDEFVGRMLSALIQVTMKCNGLGLDESLSILRIHSKVKDIPAINVHLADRNCLRSFVQSQSQYFYIAPEDRVMHYAGFNEKVFKEAIAKEIGTTTDADAVQGRSPTDGDTAAPSSDVDFANVTQTSRIIETLSETKTVLKPLLDANRRDVIVGLDCEGVRLGSYDGCMTLVQVSTVEGRAFIFDVMKNPSLLKGDSYLRRLLESTDILKVIHDCTNDSRVLFRDFDVSLRNVFDTVLAMRILMEQLNREHVFKVSFKVLCEMLGEKVLHKEDDFRTKMLETPDFWKIRPLTEEMIFYAASDALCLVPSVYQKLDGILTPIWRHFFKWSCDDLLTRMQQHRT